MQTKKTLGPMRDAVEIVRGVLGGERLRVRGRDVERVRAGARRTRRDTPRDVPPVYVAATAPKMQALAGEIGDGCLTPSITTPAFVRYTRENVGADIDIGCTVVASIDETDRDAGRDGAREIAGMYLANKVQNIQGSADTLLDLAGLEQDEIRPVAEAMERGGRLAAKAQVTDAILDKCKPIAGTPADCIAAIEEYRDAGCTHVMLELWGDDRHEQIRLFGEKVLAALPMIDRERLVADALAAVSIPSFTGSEEAMAAWYGRRSARSSGSPCSGSRSRTGARTCSPRAPATGGGPTLMFNGHMDTSYSGREPWLAGIPGFQPEGFVRDGPDLRARHLEHEGRARRVPGRAARARRTRPLKGDVHDRGRRRRDREDAAGRRAGRGVPRLRGRARATSSATAARRTCASSASRPSRSSCSAHFGTLWLRLSTTGPFIHTAFSSGRLEENSIVRMRAVLDRVLEWLPEWEEEMSYGDVRGVANVGAIQGGFGWRVSRTPHRTDLFLDLRVPPDVEMAEARRKALEFARGLEGVEAEVYVTAPGAEIDESHPLVGALEECARGGVRRGCPSATSRAGSRTRRC